MKPAEVVKKIQTDFPFEGYFEKKYVGKYASILKVIQNNLESNAKVFDFGSGAGELSAMLSQLGYDCYACDDLQDPWHLKPGNLDKIKGYYQSNKVTFEISTDTIPFQDTKFDLIMINHVLEHIHDSPRPLLEALLSQLKDGGLLLITVPSAVNIRKRLNVLRGKTNLPPYDQYFNHEGDRWRGHVREYSKGDLKQLSDFLNLTKIQIKGVDHMLNRVPSSMRPIYLALTALLPFGKDSLLFLGKK